MEKVGITRSPGGLPGIDAHVGAWKAFDEHGIKPTHVFGCSAGAIVSALQATGNYTGITAGEYIKRLKTSDFIQKRVLWKLRIFWLKSFCKHNGIRDQLNELLPEDFEELILPLVVSTTIMNNIPSSTLFNKGTILREAVLASTSIAGIWPYVNIEGSKYTDGGTTDSIVIPSDIKDYKEFYVINVFKRQDYEKRDRNIISRLLWNIDQLIKVEKEETIRRFYDNPNIKWLNINISGSSTLEFDHDLIDKAYKKAKDWLDQLRETD